MLLEEEVVTHLNDWVNSETAPPAGSSLEWPQTFSNIGVELDEIKRIQAYEAAWMSDKKRWF